MMLNQEVVDTTNAQILVVDDTPANLKLLNQTLEAKGYRVIVALDGETALNLASRTQPDLILLDIIMPGLNGIEVCRRLKSTDLTAEIPVIFLTAVRESANLFEAFKAGGVDYVVKSSPEKEVLIRVETHLKISKLAKMLMAANSELSETNERLRQEIARREQAENALSVADEQLSAISEREAEQWGIPGFIARSQTMANIMTQIRQLQNYDNISVLITGESGTGKEMIARALHFGSSRSKRPFKVVHCGAIPHELAESELFGYVKGAFTGADKDKPGAFELAAGGTLFLDEIGDMPLDLQVKLLRVLQDGSFTPLGALQERQVDVRIVAATNANLQEKIRERTFREDLFFRVSEFEVELPPLRQRIEDIPLLADHFIDLVSSELKMQKLKIHQNAVSALKSYSFPGNVRELRKIILRAFIESSGGEIRREHLHFQSQKASPFGLTPQDVEALTQDVAGKSNGYSRAVQYFRRRFIEMVLHECSGNRHEAARRLNMDRSNLIKLINQFEISSQS